MGWRRETERGRTLLAIALIAGSSILSVAPSAAQLSLEVPGIPATIDFTGFDGSGFSPDPAAGQLDSDVLSVGGFSEGDLPFATSADSGDFARGITAGGVSSGGLYAFDLGEGDMGLGVQPTASDYTPGFLTLCIENGTAMPLDRIQVTYDVVVFNDQDRSTSWNLSVASDALGPYEPVASVDFVSPEIADEEPVYTLTRRSLELTTVTLLPGERLFLHWTSDDAGGGGSRDEIGLDNVSITGRSSIPDPNLLFGDGFESGDLSAWSEWVQ